METGLLQLKQTVDLLAPLPEAEWKAFSSIWHVCAVKRKEILTRSGELERNLYFVLDGLQRVYSIDANGNEATLVFTYPPSFGGVLDAFLLQTPSSYFYEALTPGKLLKASFKDINELAQQYPAIQQLLLKGTAGALSGVLARMAEIQTASSEEKFRNLLKRSPHILQLVPHKYLANYLGIDPTNFSKLMNKVKV